MSSANQRTTGTVKWYNQKQGFGFIMPDTGGEEIFLHHSAMERHQQFQISEGDRISFAVEQRKKGPSALSVEMLGDEAPAAAPVATTGDEDQRFADLDLAENLLRAVRDAGYETPTPIQLRAIPYALAGRDLLGCAQTGTGKTAAFALPVLQHLAGASARSNGNGKKGSRRVVRALVVSPTRELAIQIAKSFETYGRYSDLRTAIVYGGVGQNPQVKALQRGVDILVATPGRLLDLMGQGHIKLDRVEVLVLDEADRMLDMGFIRDIRRIVKAMPEQRQTMLFSATMPDEIVKLAGSILRDPVEISVSPEQPTVEAIEQAVYFVAMGDKQALLEQLIEDSAVTRALVFTRTKHGADRVVKKLQRKGIRAEPIHGNKSQNARQKALKNFRQGKTRVLVATDVASRGIDVDDISHVIQFDLPNEPETYVHRIGRTGRAGAAGIALSLCSNNERPYLRDIERLMQRRVPVVKEHAYK